mgnify:FL=1
MNFNIIVAVDNKNGIGYDNTIPWYEPDDLKHFSKTTKGDFNNAIIMGSKTWESLPVKPLKNRDNLILSRKNHSNGDGFYHFKNIKDVIEYCKSKKYDEVWVVGGSEIYKLFLDNNLIDNIYLSRVSKEYECNIFFPNIPDNFQLIKKKSINNNIELEIYSS